MQAIGYYLALPFLYLISLLPAPIFYGFSDLVFFLLYYVTGYRKKVVMENLRNSFPEKSEEDLRKIMRGFYSFLCDIFLETFRTLTMRRNFAVKHCDFDPKSKELFDEYNRNKKSIIAVMGHFGNWEWSGHSFSISCQQQLYVIYRPLANMYFNKLIVRMRTRFGAKVIDMPDTFKEMVRNRSEVSTTAFIADQTPSVENAWWTTFLNQETPVFRGVELIARKMNYPVIYAGVHRLKRGHYRIFAETLFEEPAKTAEGEISEAHIRRLEKDIREQPETWLWSHRRWKHKRARVET